ncbi:agamous-like MADS-box protein AGL103 [Cucurbita moschata]|uniref:Agamous-like MADS-box protein AGL103 n=1 Tax=Cucurbita moschata TaxID=3662 RepID=A0A6J1EVI5_CUCMO|nr:agamous-like MADS-box protein AGL103 [Cucurbita moschata]
MGRGKLSMQLIGNEKSRKTTFLKRKKSLLRKAYELSTLCDVRACVFVYGPNHNDQSPVELNTWPPCREEVNNMIASYKANCLHKRARKAFDLLDFFSERKKKLENDMSKLRKDVLEARFPKWDERLDHLTEDQLRILMVKLDSKLDTMKRRIEIVTENHEEGTSGENNQTLIANMKPEQVMSYGEQSYEMFGNPSMETRPMMPFHHQYHQQLQTMAQNRQMDHELENLSQILFGSNGSTAQIESNYGNNCFQNPNFYTDPTNGMVMDNTQGYSMCHYGVPRATQSVLPVSYMPLIDDQMMMACALNTQMGLANTSAQVNDQFDCFNYEYFMKPNNF